MEKAKGTSMEWIDWIQWPAMVVTVVAAWLIGSLSKGRRNVGFWLFLVSNALWIVWGFSTQAWALVTLQVLLGLMNIRGAKKTDTETSNSSTPDNQQNTQGTGTAPGPAQAGS